MTLLSVTVKVARADVNGDGAVNVLDVQRIVNVFLMGAV